MFGFVPRYLFTIKDNYFGNNTGFITSEELLVRLKDPDKYQKQIKRQQRAKPMENFFDIHISTEWKKSCLSLPNRLYNSFSELRVYSDHISFDIRNHPEYMGNVLIFYQFYLCRLFNINC